MAIALAGIAAPVTEAASTVESTDFSNNPFAPTSLGAFQPLSDDIQGTVANAPSADVTDAILLTGPASTSISIPFSFTATMASPYFHLRIYDNPVDSPLAGGDYTTATGGETFSFTIPADGSYIIQLSRDGESAGAGTFSYVFGVPEPSAGLLLTAGAAVAAMRRRRKSAAPES